MPWVKTTRFLPTTARRPTRLGASRPRCEPTGPRNSAPRPGLSSAAYRAVRVPPNDGHSGAVISTGRQRARTLGRTTGRRSLGRLRT